MNAIVVKRTQNFTVLSTCFGLTSTIVFSLSVSLRLPSSVGDISPSLPIKVKAPDRSLGVLHCDPSFFDRRQGIILSGDFTFSVIRLNRFLVVLLP
jgi:hypothetical protein